MTGRWFEACLVRRRGRIEEAERQYRRIVADYPEDAEAWFHLAEVLFHFNPLRGRSTTEARPALERLLALEPASPEALLHLARIAALEGKNGQADSLVRLAARAAPDSVVMGLRAFRGFALGDRPADYQSTRELIGSSGFVPAVRALGAAAYVDDLTGSERFATLLARHTRSCEVRALAGGCWPKPAWRAAYPIPRRVGSGRRTRVTVLRLCNCWRCTRVSRLYTPTASRCASYWASSGPAALGRT
jgi:tetratricopeptide (TPR) repeat protein